MILTDKELFQQGSSLIAPFEQNQVTNIGYDLKTECFFLDAKTSKTEVELAPGDTVFVRTVETISLPDDMAAAGAAEEQPHSSGPEPDRPDLPARPQDKGLFPGDEHHQEDHKVESGKRPLPICSSFRWERAWKSPTMVRSRMRRLLLGWGHISPHWAMI